MYEYMHVYIFMYVRMDACINICMYVCMYLDIYEAHFSSPIKALRMWLHLGSEQVGLNTPRKSN